MNKKDVCAQFQCARDATDTAGSAGKTRDATETHNTCC
jgi:hypothetical protein